MYNVNIAMNMTRGISQNVFPSLIIFELILEGKVSRKGVLQGVTSVSWTISVEVTM